MSASRNFDLRPFAAAALAALLVLAWQAATVHANYQGNWTALFSVGGRTALPDELARGVWRFAESEGYDGQWYRIVAHDPWMQEGSWSYLDSPRRYHRILLPAVAWALALGQSGWIDAAYIATVLAFLFAGVWVTAAWGVSHGLSPWWGLAFPVLPGALISFDRMTVDIALYTLIAAGLYCWRRAWWLGCWAAGAGAFLTRDLGLLLIAAFSLACLLQREWRRSVLLASAALPCWLWVQYVGYRTSLARGAQLIPRWTLSWSLTGPFEAILNPPDYPLPAWTKTATQCLDGLAVAAVIIAIGVALIRLRQPPLDPEKLLCALFVIVFVMVSTSGFWIDPYSYSRAFTPLAGLLAWRAVRERRAWLAVPMSLMVARVVWQMGPQALGILKAILA